MKKAIIFGGSGFIGSYVADELIKRGYKITIADLNEPKGLNSNYTFKKIDILDFDDVKKTLNDETAVYNFSAVAELEEAIANPLKTFQVNVIGHLNILEACKNIGLINRIVYASSAYALSSHGSFYGLSKQSSEKLTEEYYKRYGIKYTIIRYGSLYGERAGKNNYIYKLLKSAISNQELIYAGDDNDTREYIHAADAAKLSVDILEDTKYENENIILTGTERLKRIELITMINEILGGQLKITQTSNKNTGHYKITPYSYQTSVAKKLISNPFIDLGQGLLNCIHTITKELD